MVLFTEAYNANSRAMDTMSDSVVNSAVSNQQPNINGVIEYAVPAMNLFDRSISVSLGAISSPQISLKYYIWVNIYSLKSFISYFIVCCMFKQIEKKR
jgi:hypothetical protein